MDEGPMDSNDADGAERAFEALCKEVARLRGGMELMYRQMQQVKLQVEVTASDHTLMLKEIITTLKSMNMNIQPEIAEEDSVINSSKPTIEVVGLKKEMANEVAPGLKPDAASKTSREIPVDISLQSPRESVDQPQLPEYPLSTSGAMAREILDKVTKSLLKARGYVEYHPSETYDPSNSMPVRIKAAQELIVSNNKVKDAAEAKYEKYSRNQRNT